MRRYLIFILIPFLLGATYYVSPSGDDSDDGSSGTPWETIQKGCDNLSAGDTLIIKDGTYRTSQTCTGIQGTEGSPITIQAETEYGAVFSMALDVDTWSDEGSNIWSSPNASGNGQSSGSTLWKVGENTAYVRELAEVDLDAVREFWYDITNDRFKIYSTTDPNLDSWKGWGSGYTAFNLYDAEWVILDGLKAEYNNVGIITGAGSGSCAIGTNNIVIQNTWSRFATHWGMATTSAEDCQTHYFTGDNLLIQYVDRVSTNSNTHNGHCFKFAANVNAAGGIGAVIKNSTVHDCDSQGIQHSNGWAEGEFYNNTVHDVGLRASGSSSAISCNWGTDTLGGCDVYNNTLYGGSNPGSTGIYIQGGANDVHIYKNSISGFDWHGIYVFNTATNNDIWIYNNLIYNNKTTGIRIEQSTGSNYLYNNTFYKNGYSPLYSTGASVHLRYNTADGFTIFNNIFYQTNSYSFSNDSNTTAVYHDFGNSYYRSDGGDVIKYNGTDYSLAEYVAVTSGDALPKGTRSIESDPLFTDIDTSDFTLQDTSPAKMKAVVYKTLVDDYNDKVRGDIWDIGAYESSKEVTFNGVTLNKVTF